MKKTKISCLSSNIFFDTQYFKTYRENVDTTSFAGSVIKKIANEEGKFEIFDEVAGNNR